MEDDDLERDLDQLFDIIRDDPDRDGALKLFGDLIRACDAHRGDFLELRKQLDIIIRRHRTMH
jgi:hypothetical protein